MTNTSEMPTGTAAITLPDIREWLVGRVAFYLEIPVEAVDADAGLVELGLDSIYAMTLGGDVEERFGLEFEPTVVWDYGSVNKLAGFLLGELTGSR